MVLVRLGDLAMIVEMARTLVAMAMADHIQIEVVVDRDRVVVDRDRVVVVEGQEVDLAVVVEGQDEDLAVVVEGQDVGLAVVEVWEWDNLVLCPAQRVSLYKTT